MTDFAELMRVILSEDEDPKTKLKDKVATDLKFDDPPSKGELAKPTEAKPKTSVDLRSQNRAQTRRAATTARVTGAMPELMNRVMDMDLTDDVPGVDQTFGFDEPTPPTPENLPATIPLHDLPMVMGEDPEVGFEPKITWHELRNLPGYMLQQIRGAFRPLFRDLLGAELEELKVSTNIMPPGQGGTGMRSMRAMIGYLGRMGQTENIDLEHFDIDPEVYHVGRAYVIDCEGNKFLVMRETHMGQDEIYYVYAAEGKGRGTTLTGPTNDTKRIGR
jgi:hypothetical protein